MSIDEIPGYTINAKLGSGGFGEVYKCTSIKNGDSFAAKILDGNNDQGAIRRFRKEVRIQSDLDNQTIYNDVIKVLRKLKGKIQFIFATHNANIPVLGDSDQIISCSCSNNIFQAFPASIDNREIQNRIVDVMEGGKEAFSRRKEIYDNWKHK